MYDRLQNLAENHRALMQMLQIGNWEDVSFRWQRIRDNVCLLDEETIEKINHLVVEAGHRLHPEAAKAIRGDSFAMDTNIHYPTDSSLILDGLIKIVALVGDVAKLIDFAGWRQRESLLKKAKQAARAISRAKGARSKARTKAYEKLFHFTEILLSRTQEMIDDIYLRFNHEQANQVAFELIYWHSATMHVYINIGHLLCHARCLYDPR